MIPVPYITSYSTCSMYHVYLCMCVYESYIHTYSTCVHDTCTHIYVCTTVCMCMYVHVYVYTYTHMYICEASCTVHVHVCMYVLFCARDNNRMGPLKIKI